jgi:membrane protein DedA with SNARE-associated domain
VDVTWLELAVDWVVGQVQHWGYLGIFVMMLVESSFVPFPSEVALIPAGYLASKGLMDPYAATATGLAGSLAGAFVNYGLALWLGRGFLERLTRFERLVPLGTGSLEVAERYFERHGEVTTFVCRLLPGVRQLISVPAGLARMNVPRFAFYTGLGAGLWSAVLVAVGFLAGESEEVWRPLLREATLWILLGVAVLVAAYVYLHRRTSRAV